VKLHTISELHTDSFIQVLAGAVVLVFCLGWTKLWWVTRRNRKQAAVDEEKRVKIQDLRMSGVIIKLDPENHVPFGVRALQSGLEIDGIWVSASPIPIPESLKQLRDSEQSSGSSFGSNNDRRPFSHGDLTPPRISFSGPLQPAFRPSLLSVEPRMTNEAFRPSTFKTLSRDLPSAYKPTRSSHLRFSSSEDNQVDQDTLAQLEGAGPTFPKNTHHDRRSYMQANTVDSSSDAVAYNERSSGSGSCCSLTDEKRISESQQLVRVTSSGATSEKSNRGRGRGDQASEDSTTSVRLPNKSGYFVVPPDSPPRPKMNPFATPVASPTLVSISMGVTNRLATDDIEAFGETRWPLLSKSSTESEPIFTTGTLHVNKTARRINSGFELLPAGTFDITTITVRDGTDGTRASAESGECNERKRSKKLQKRGRDSVTGNWMSTIFRKF
jgi:hypothetical protein